MQRIVNQNSSNHHSNTPLHSNIEETIHAWVLGSSFLKRLKISKRHIIQLTFQNIYLAKIFTFTYICIGFTLNESLKYNNKSNLTNLLLKNFYDSPLINKDSNCFHSNNLADVIENYVEMLRWQNTFPDQIVC